MRKLKKTIAGVMLATSMTGVIGGGVSMFSQPVTVMAATTGVVTKNGVKYLYLDNGKLPTKTGFYQSGNNIYYTNAQGVIQYAGAGLKTINGDTYYFEKDGSVARGVIRENRVFADGDLKSGGGKQLFKGKSGVVSYPYGPVYFYLKNGVIDTTYNGFWTTTASGRIYKFTKGQTSEYAYTGYYTEKGVKYYVNDGIKTNKFITVDNTRQHCL